AEKIARVANPLILVAQQQPVYHPQHHTTQFTQNSSTISQQAATGNRGKAIVNSPQPIYDQEPHMVDEDDETSKDKEIDKLMALISLSAVIRKLTDVNINKLHQPWKSFAAIINKCLTGKSSGYDSLWLSQAQILTMDTTIDQQVARDDALVPHAKRLRIGRSNFCLLSNIKSKESTFQLVYDVLRLTPFFKAFLVTADVPEMYIQEF
nr:hypothetical protein [Tanacetum cinerariifolium]